MIRPLRYRLEIDADAQSRSFCGEVSIALAVTQATTQLRLDCEALEILSASIDGEPATWVQESAGLVLTPSSPLTPGDALAEIRFRGQLGGDPRGLYIGEGFVATQLQPANARRVFPCFDEPRFRTPFDIATWVAEGHTAISNASILREDTGSGRRRIAFASTPSLPTHLVALAIGLFQKLADEGEAPALALHTLHSPERCELVLAAARQALGIYSRWLGRPYPWDKLDLVVLPRMGAAGMENSGAIFLRESVVALASDAAPPAQREAAALVAHEIAHQWFGGLVTPADWRDLWLNEGLATWLAPKGMAAAHDQDLDAVEVRSLREALHRDSGPGSRPLVTGGDTPAEIVELFDPIAYRKGAALLRMLEAWLGEAAMQRGLKLYLDRHANQTVTSEDLWTALEEASGKPVVEVSRSFATRVGAPHITIRWSGDTVDVSQPEAHFRTPMRLRVALQDGTEEIVSLLLAEATARVTLPCPIRWVFGDAGAVGYYRCSYPDGPPPIAALSPSEAVVLVEDAWIALWAGETDLLGYLTLADAALATQAAMPSLQSHLVELRDLLATGARAPLLERWAGGRLSTQAEDQPTLADLALLDDPQVDESRLIALVEALLGNPATRDACWAAIKARWSDVGHRLVGLGGRGVIAALAAFSDHAASADIAAFFADRKVPGAERTLSASLHRIAGRTRFRESHQLAMDAFLMRQGAPAGPPSERLRNEHLLLAGMSAGFRGALLQRGLFDNWGLSAPPWMHTPQNLRTALGMAERQLTLLHRGAPVLSRGDLDLANRLREDLLATAQDLATAMAKLPQDTGREAFLVVAAGLARVGVMAERELEARIVFAALFDPAQAAGLRQELAATQATFKPARAWIAAHGALLPTLQERHPLAIDAAHAPDLLRRQALRIETQLAALATQAQGAIGADG